ncbi:MAG: MucR family transcriptional regulator [Desulfobaccales bacterium]|nr:MucR family transcriptional regulator [Desulfobaccales bacterium]
MASEVLNLTAQIVISHASMTELTPKELVKEIKEVYSVLASLEDEIVVPETMAPVARSRKTRSVKMVESPEAKAIQDEEGPVLGDPDYLEFMASREG